MEEPSVDDEQEPRNQEGQGSSVGEQSKMVGFGRRMRREGED